MDTRRFRKYFPTKFLQTLLKFLGVSLLVGIGLSFLFNISIVLKNYLIDYKIERAGYYYKQINEDLLPSRFNESSCVSRFDSLLLQRPTLRKPSPYLLSKLREYEARHKRCAPYTSLYNSTVDTLRANTSAVRSTCKYNIWFSNGGLANRMISVTSAFLHALLTDRVLFIHPQDNVAGLFCEPFPDGSWLLPIDFPIHHEMLHFTKGLNESFRERFGNGSSVNSSSSSPLHYLYVYLNHNADNLDKRFFCDEEQSHIQDVPWLIILSNQYFLPSLFSMPSFQHELENLFPDKGAVFHLLGGYLLNPNNAVWGLVRRFYEAYLSEYDVKVGLQIRTFHYDTISPEEILDQVISCITDEGLIPHAYPQEQENFTETLIPKKKKRIVLLITSLYRSYYGNLSQVYWENATITGDTIAIHQPSFEERQYSGNFHHNQKALAELYLLTLTDQLVVSATSTFGYVAQGLSGLMPWVLFKSKLESELDRPCHRILTIEPCYHTPPKYYCKMRRAAGTSVIGPHIKECPDSPGGAMLFDNQSYIP